MNLYVSNLSYTLTDDELRGAFEAYGAVSSARVITDRETGRSRGFGFVEMPNNAEASAAIEGMNGSEVGGRAVKVVEARPKEERPSGGFGGGGAPRGGGGGGAPRGGGGGGGRRDSGGGGGGGRDRDRGWDRGKRGGNEDDEGGW